MKVTVDGAPVDYDKCPECARETMRRYIEIGIHPGSGYRMVLERDLMAVLAVDAATREQLPAIVRWLHNYAPTEAWGSKEKVSAWIIQRKAESARREIVDTMHNMVSQIGGRLDGTFAVEAK